MGYWDYYYTPKPPIRVKDGIKTKSEKGAIGETWWSKRWVSVLESFGMGARLTRGRSYARQGQVISIDVQPGIVKAKVQGSRPTPYSITIRLKPLSDQEWEEVTEAMASQAIFVAKLLAGEMPTNIEEAFSAVNISLFPTSTKELDTDCSCPDWANPCKHIAAVYYLLAERFDEDPFLIFKLRGRTKEQIITALRQKRVETISEDEKVSSVAATSSSGHDKSGPYGSPLEERLETFWEAGEGLDSFAVKPAAPEIDQAILKRLGEAPFTVGGKNITSLLSKAYSSVDTALQKMAEEEPV